MCRLCWPKQRRRYAVAGMAVRGPGALHEWVAPLLEAFGENGWGLLDFLTVPRHGFVADVKLDGESLLQRIQAGDVQFALEAARRSNLE